MWKDNTSSSIVKRKPFVDLTNISSEDDEPLKSDDKYDVLNMLPTTCESNELHVAVDDDKRFQNVHPLLGWYKHDLETGILSYDSFMQLMDPSNELPLLNLLTEIGVIADSNQCLFCGGEMKRMKHGAHWVWMCTRRVEGVKCNKGKKSIRTGTIFGNSHLSTQEILQIIWHFVHHLSETQCVQYTKISSKNNTTIVKWYRFCREVCTNWFWNPANTPKLGGYGKIVEMDESYFPGLPERGSLDAVIVQVPSNSSRKVLLPIIDKHCRDGSIFCSDGWKAYNQLKDHLQLDDCLHFAVNHSNNYVDPHTGAYTQTVEGMWRHCKDFLPRSGMKPKDLRTYIGAFCWTRYCKQRNLDMFIHFLRSASEVHPPVKNQLPNGKVITV